MCTPPSPALVPVALWLGSQQPAASHQFKMSVREMTFSGGEPTVEEKGVRKSSRHERSELWRFLEYRQARKLIARGLAELQHIVRALPGAPQSLCAFRFAFPVSCTGEKQKTKQKKKKHDKNQEGTHEGMIFIASRIPAARPDGVLFSAQGSSV